MRDNNLPQTASEVEQVLRSLHEKRGYLLPHHGLLAISSPKLLDAYDATYTETASFIEINQLIRALEAVDCFINPCEGIHRVS